MSVRKTRGQFRVVRFGSVPFMLACCLCFTFTGVILFWPASLEHNEIPRGSETTNTLKDYDLMAIINKIRKNSKRNLQFLSPLKVFGSDQKQEVFQPREQTTNSVLEESQWLRANNASSDVKLLVYSAYWDNRANFGCVRVIATTWTKQSPPLQCRLRFNGIPDTIVVPVIKKPLNEHWNLKYSSYLLSCCFKPQSGHKVVPDRVSVYVTNQEEFAATLTVRNNLQDNQSARGTIGLCVKPFHYNFNRATWLVEFMEYHLMMGVENFLFYNNSVGPDVQRILDSYRARGVVQIQPWKLDVVTKKEIRTEGMFGALNDCLFRYMFLFKYVLVVDVDEYLVPKIHENYTEMVASFEKRSAVSHNKNEKCIAGFIFKNFFYYMYWENDTSLYGQEPEMSPRFLPYLLTQYKTRRLVSGHKHGQRSKYFVAPDKALEIGNHAVWRKLPGCTVALIGEEIATLNHYRICEFGGYECLKKKSVIDRTSHKFGIDLLKRVLRSCYQIFPEVGSTCPVTGPLGSPY